MAEWGAGGAPVPRSDTTWRPPASTDGGRRRSTPSRGAMWVAGKHDATGVVWDEVEGADVAGGMAGCLVSTTGEAPR